MDLHKDKATPIICFSLALSITVPVESRVTLFFEDEIYTIVLVRFNFYHCRNHRLSVQSTSVKILEVLSNYGK